MATPQPAHAHNAHYHPIRVTEAWKAFTEGMATEATNAATKRAQRRAQRERETTYARGELGGS